tara:strand:+ start:891 stop:1475 length:585 start_codon:yes stop_codon:yes gene_type:complete
MSTLVTTNLKNPSSSGNNIVLNADGSTTPGLGKVLQVVQVSSDAVQSTASTSFVDVPGMSLNITPTSSTSQILCHANIGLSWDGEGYVQLIRTVSGSTSIIGSGTSSTYQGFAGGWTGSGGGVHTYGLYTHSTQTLDAAVNTTAHTYTLKWMQYAANYIVMNASYYAAFGGGGYSNPNYNPSGFSSITLYEIGA